MTKTLTYRQLCRNITAELQRMLKDMAYKKRFFGTGSKDVLGLIWTFTPPLYDFLRLIYQHSNLTIPLLKWHLKKSIRTIFRQTWKPKCQPAPHAHLKHKHWQQYAFFRMIKVTYIELHHICERVLRCLPIKTEAKERIQFSLNIFLSTLNPANFFPLNPEVLEATWRQKGKNILQGMLLWLKDANDWHGYIHYHKNEYKPLKLGDKIATTSKQVALKNKVMELLYFPCKHKSARPILIVPSWINKYYIFDLKKDKSIVQWLQQQGFDVYIISWTEPSHSENPNITHYIRDGIFASLDFVLHQHAKCHIMGYCLGGTILSMALSIYPRLKYIKSISLVATILDFSDAKPLSFFFQKEQIIYYQSLMHKANIWDGRRFATAFNLLNPDDYIWFYWINRYAKGKIFPAIDALIWSADLTNASCDMYTFYMKDLYYENKLVTEKMCIGEQTILLKTIQTPTLNIAFENDHISPVVACKKNVTLLSNATNLITKGGHFTGICRLPNTDNQSWWQQWHQWIEQQDTTLLDNTHKESVGELC